MTQRLQPGVPFKGDGSAGPLPGETSSPRRRSVRRTISHAVECNASERRRLREFTVPGAARRIRRLRWAPRCPVNRCIADSSAPRRGPVRCDSHIPATLAFHTSYRSSCCTYRAPFILCSNPSRAERVVSSQAAIRPPQANSARCDSRHQGSSRENPIHSEGSSRHVHVDPPGS